jgi:hypothetical protein
LEEFEAAQIGFPDVEALEAGGRRVQQGSVARMLKSDPDADT